MERQTISDLITIDEVKNWNKGEIITISAQMGYGKSYFIKNRLYEIAKENNQKIILLVHRTRCKQQFIQELEKNHKLDVIDVVTYQTLENRKDFDVSKYDYIVCDEFHYFTSDSNFNYKTDISLEKILGQTNKIKIFMSATGDLMKRYFEHRNLKTKDYEIKANFDWINELIFFNKDETIEGIIEDIIDNDEKAIVFIESVEKAYKLYKKYKKYSLFCCSKSNKKYRYVDEDDIEGMLKNEKFEDNLLITTTCLDAGINLRDDEIKTIICDVPDIGVLLQCLGRKRRKENEKVDVYIHNINNNVLGGYETKVKLGMKMIKDFNTITIDEFTEKYSKSINDYYNTLFYDEGSTKKLNELMAFKLMEQLILIKTIKGNEDKKGCGYKNYLARNIFELEYKTLEITYEHEELEEYLDKIVGKKLFKEEQKELIDKINVRVNGRQQKTYKKLNEGLNMLSLSYIILPKKSNNMRYWTIEKIYK
ncbi:restriction endonuclease subunit R [Clostridium perfringens]|nr:restriction endonuclease subunit R [Clostridium perfringens]